MKEVKLRPIDDQDAKLQAADCTAAVGNVQSSCGYPGRRLGPHDGHNKQPQGSTDMNARPNIVLVHGAWADGAGWSAVSKRPQASGYDVTAPQFPRLITTAAETVSAPGPRA